MIALLDTKYIIDYYEVNSFVLNDLFKIEVVDPNESIPVSIECTIIENDIYDSEFSTYLYTKNTTDFLIEDNLLCKNGNDIEIKGNAQVHEFPSFNLLELIAQGESIIEIPRTSIDLIKFVFRSDFKLKRKDNLWRKIHLFIINRGDDFPNNGFSEMYWKISVIDKNIPFEKLVKKVYRTFKK